MHKIAIAGAVLAVIASMGGPATRAAAIPVAPTWNGGSVQKIGFVYRCSRQWPCRQYWQWGWHHPPWQTPWNRPDYWSSLNPPLAPADIWTHKWHPPWVGPGSWRHRYRRNWR